MALTHVLETPADAAGRLTCCPGKRLNALHDRACDHEVQLAGFESSQYLATKGKPQLELGPLERGPGRAE